MLASRTIQVINRSLADAVTFSVWLAHTAVGYSDTLNNQEKRIF